MKSLHPHSLSSYRQIACPRAILYLEGGVYRSVVLRFDLELGELVSVRNDVEGVDGLALTEYFGGLVVSGYVDVCCLGVLADSLVWRRGVDVVGVVDGGVGCGRVSVVQLGRRVVALDMVGEVLDDEPLLITDFEGGSLEVLSLVFERFSDVVFAISTPDRCEVAIIEFLISRGGLITLATLDKRPSHALPDMVAELVCKLPSVSVVEILRWATSNGAKALGVNDKYGSLEEHFYSGALLLEGLSLSSLTPVGTIKSKRLL